MRSQPHPQPASAMQLSVVQPGKALRLALLGGIMLLSSTLLTVNADQLGPNEHFLRYPPRPLPAKACACRVDMQKRAVASSCPTPWDSIAGTSKVPPALKLSSSGDLIEATSGRVAKLHGVNWFGWETDSPSMDGLWAYDDDEVPPSSSISDESMHELQVNFWGKRTMTNDFAHVVHRIKALGFNAVRLPMNFTNLQRDIPRPKWDATEYYACVRDPVDYINLNRTLDPSLAHISRQQLAAAAPAYTGMRHPPVVQPEDASSCSTAWEAPFLSNYTAPKQYGDKLQLTLCNWYLPQGEGVQAAHRFLWQLQYLVAQGFYVVIDHQSYQERDPNMQNPALFAANWGNLWRMITELRGYQEHMKGRVFPDLVNEPSRWGCMWERECFDAQGQKACAVGSWLYHEAMRAIHTADPDVPIFANAMGQSWVDPVKFPTCTKFFKGMNFGEGTITNKAILDATGISDPLRFFKDMPAGSAGKLALAPHVYPATLTGLGVETQARAALFARLDLSFGLKALGRDLTSDLQPLPRMAVVLGEFGVRDRGAASQGSGSKAGEDFSDIDAVDITFLRDLSDYLKGLETQGATVSWFWWAWNANSGDTKGIVGPETMWRDVQFKKVQLLSQLYGLRPWYCTAAPDACACGGAGCGGASDSHMRTPYAGAAAQQIMTADVKQLMALAGRRLRALAV